MATKQYEYFGNQNPVMNGRYNRGRVDAQRLANDRTVLGNINTPFGIGYQIGSAIGNAWADTYNERGIEKGRGEMQAALDNYLQQNGRTQQQSTQKEAGPLRQTFRDKAMPDFAGQLNNGKAPTFDMLQSDLANGNIGGVLNNMGIGLNPLSPQDQYKEYKNQAWLEQYRNPNTPNPTGDAIQAKQDTQAMDKMGDGIDFGKINKEDARQAMREQLRQNGRTPYQIDQVMANFDSMYDAKYGKWREAKATDWIEKGAQAAKEGRWDDAQNAYLAAGQYDPKRAGMHMQGMQQSYARQLQAKQQRDKEYMAGYMRDENGNLVINSSHPIWARKYARNGNNITTTNPYGEGRWIGKRNAITNEEFDNANSVLSRYKDYDGNDPRILNQIENANKVIDLYYSPNHGATEGWNIDDPNSVGNYFRGVLASNKSTPEKLAAIERSGITASPFYDAEVILPALGIHTSDQVYDDLESPESRKANSDFGSVHKPSPKGSGPYVRNVQKEREQIGGKGTLGELLKGWGESWDEAKEKAKRIKAQ